MATAIGDMQKNWRRLYVWTWRYAFGQIDRHAQGQTDMHIATLYSRGYVSFKGTETVYRAGQKRETTSSQPTDFQNFSPEVSLVNLQ